MQDRTIEDTWTRVARSLSSVEKEPHEWQKRFYTCLQNFRFLPGGRILASAGANTKATLLNCFVMGVIEDSMDAIFEGLKEGALTMQQGGGVGYDFSTLRPKGVRAQSTGRIASGPVSFMRIWNTMCATVLTTGARRGAMMATLRCDHPDILDFVKAKQKKASDLQHFNLSVLVSDDFISAVRADGEWDLVFPEVHLEAKDKDRRQVWRQWTGEAAPVSCRVLKTVSARELWKEIITCTYNSAEPGVLFIDRINHMNNLWYCENISATNPCGEIPLAPYGACDLGSVNLTQFVSNPFKTNAEFDWPSLRESVPYYVRMLDNVIDASKYPLPKQMAKAHSSRRIGLGLTGLADALTMLGLDYRSPAARGFAAEIMQTICYRAYEASTELAVEKGAFEEFDCERYLKSRFIQSLPESIKSRIQRSGIRNSHILAIAPTGTISILANNVSSGIEPIFSRGYRRRVLQIDGSYLEYDVVDFAVDLWHRLSGNQPLPATFVFSHEIDPNEHLLMQAALQPFIDNSISKTINVATDFAFERFSNIYDLAYDLGLKGCTTFRENAVTGSILSSP